MALTYRSLNETAPGYTFYNKEHTSFTRGEVLVRPKRVKFVRSRVIYFGYVQFSCQLRLQVLRVV